MAYQGQQYSTYAGRVNTVKGAILKHAIPVEVLNITGNQHKIGKNQGDTVIFRRFLPKGGATTNSTTINRWTVTTASHLTQEGVTPEAETIIPQDITVTLDQYSCLYSYTDKTAELYEDKIPTHMKKQAGERMGLLREMIAYGALKGCTNKFYAGGTSRATVDETVSLETLRLITRSLEGNRCDMITQVIEAGPNYNTAPVEPGYLVFINTDAAHDVRNLDGFTKCVEYGSGMKQIHKREIGAVDEYRFVRSPELGSVADSGAAVGSTGLYSTTGTSIDVYPTIVVADDAWGNVSLRGKDSFDVIHIPHTQQSKSDPLGQRGYIGSKFYSAAFVQNDGWMAVLEMGITKLTS